MTQHITAYEVSDLGINHPQYFPGFGTSLTPYTYSAVGIGDTYNEALSDALDMIAQSHDIANGELDIIEDIEKLPEAENSRTSVSMELTDGDEDEDDYAEDYPQYYVGIRYNLSDEE